jgi:hypothetical protein
MSCTPDYKQDRPMHVVDADTDFDDPSASEILH